MKKYTSGSFTATKYAIYKEDTDTITSFPAEIIADGENASALVYGNMQQTGTPTPTTPITPSECGDLVASGEHAGQYTIPIISGGVTTNIYIGEVQSTRQIRKYVIDGTENWIRTSNGAYYLSSVDNPMNNYKFINANISINSHFESQGSVSASSFVNDGKSAFFYNSVSSTREYYIAARNISTVEDFKTFLAQQYSAGTPVTVWYVLEDSTTGTLNEQLRKIGDYADSIAAAAIPTTAGSQIFSIDTTLKPSSVDLTYTGWHKYDDKKRSGGSWGTVTSNDKKKKSLLGSRKTTKGKT